MRMTTTRAFAHRSTCERPDGPRLLLRFFKPHYPGRGRSRRRRFGRTFFAHGGEKAGVLFVVLALLMRVLEVGPRGGRQSLRVRCGRREGLLRGLVVAVREVFVQVHATVMVVATSLVRTLLLLLLLLLLGTTAAIRGFAGAVIVMNFALSRLVAVSLSMVRLMAVVVSAVAMQIALAVAPVRLGSFTETALLAHPEWRMM